MVLYDVIVTCIENTSLNSYSIVASRGYSADRVENIIPVLLFMALT
jgi:hypothetical protein